MEQSISPNGHLDEAVREYYGRVYNFVLRRVRDPDEVADITQNVFLNALRYDNFKGRSDIVTWLCAIAKSEVYRHSQRIQRDKQRFSQDIDPDDLSSKTENPEQLLIESERVSLAQRIGTEKGRKFKPLFLQAGGFSDKEIADILGIKLGTVKSRNFHARRYLADKYSGQYQQV